MKAAQALSPSIESIMTASNRDFLIELYQEHLEEASFLYEQRLELFQDPEVAWTDIDDFEQRLEAHIDALVLGGQLALDICRTQATEGDFGELHAALRVFCRQDRKDLVFKAIERIDPDDPESIQAAGDALKHEAPDTWQNEFIRILSESEPKVVAILTEVLGFRRRGGTTELLKMLNGPANSSLPRIVWAIGRLRKVQARDALLQLLFHQDHSVQKAAVLALLWLGEWEAVKYCLRNIGSVDWVVLPLTLGGPASAVDAVLKLARGDNVGPDCLLALGLFGDISAIDGLLEHLGNKDLASTAALALHLITGAPCYEEVLIPEQIEEDELFPDELEDMKKGKYPTRPDGEPYGAIVTRISQDVNFWTEWWSKNKASFKEHIRYRNGRPYSPACLLKNLQSESSPSRIRQLAYEELVIRYAADVPFETDMLVCHQKQALAKFEEWIQTAGARFQEGHWYFAGQGV